MLTYPDSAAWPDLIPRILSLTILIWNATMFWQILQNPNNKAIF